MKLILSAFISLILSTLVFGSQAISNEIVPSSFHLQYFPLFNCTGKGESSDGRPSGIAQGINDFKIMMRGVSSRDTTLDAMILFKTPFWLENVNSFGNLPAYYEYMPNIGYEMFVDPWDNSDEINPKTITRVTLLSENIKTEEVFNFESGSLNGVLIETLEYTDGSASTQVTEYKFHCRRP